MKTVVFDLDGTLANLEHRVHLVKTDSPNWDEFYNSCGKDEPNYWCVDLISAMKRQGHKVVIVSARRRDVLSITVAWLRNHFVEYDELVLLRPEDDYTPDHILKKKWLQEDSKRKEEILFVVDDRQRVVNMWREEGLTCLQCYAWEEFKRKKNVPAP